MACCDALPFLNRDVSDHIQSRIAKNETPKYESSLKHNFITLTGVMHNLNLTEMSREKLEQEIMGLNRERAELIEQLNQAPAAIAGPELPTRSADDPTEAIYVISSVYKCDKCDKWHLGGAATAWCLSGDGIMVTNYHVFENAKGARYGVASRDGEAWPVMEVLADDKKADLAIFRVKGEGFQRFAIGAPAEVGDKIRVISHPNRKFFLQTSGEVARYHLHRSRKNKEGAVRMSVTADYAKGSSGGPVLNEAGEVVGVVSSTQSIYYSKDEEGDQENLQMVVKNTVPVAAVKAMLE